MSTFYTSVLTPACRCGFHPSPRKLIFVRESLQKTTHNQNAELWSPENLVEERAEVSVAILLKSNQCDFSNMDRQTSKLTNPTHRTAGNYRNGESRRNRLCLGKAPSTGETNPRSPVSWPPWSGHGRLRHAGPLAWPLPSLTGSRGWSSLGHSISFWTLGPHFQSWQVLGTHLSSPPHSSIVGSSETALTGSPNSTI